MTWDQLEAAYRHLTDKFSNGYGPVYQRLWGTLPRAARVLEVGVAGGGSLRLWQAAFPGGLIVGVDCDSSAGWPDGTVRIVADQDSPKLPVLAWEASPGGYDLIIDDASHLGQLSRVTFDLLWPLVVPGGWYVFEDWAVGVPGNDPFFGIFDGTSQLDFAQDLLARCGRFPGREDADTEEFLGRAGVIALRKKAAR